jgi:hypothetical protein
MAEVIEGNGGLPKVRITLPAAAGEMYPKRRPPFLLAAGDQEAQASSDPS